MTQACIRLSAVGGTNTPNIQTPAAFLLADSFFFFPSTSFALLTASFIKLRFVWSCEIQTLEQQVMLCAKSAFCCLIACACASPSGPQRVFGVAVEPVSTVNSHYTPKKKKNTLSGVALPRQRTEAGI